MDATGSQEYKKAIEGQLSKRLMFYRSNLMYCKLCNSTSYIFAPLVCSAPTVNIKHAKILVTGLACATINPYICTKLNPGL